MFSFLKIIFGITDYRKNGTSHRSCPNSSAKFTSKEKFLHVWEEIYMMKAEAIQQKNAYLKEKKLIYFLRLVVSFIIINIIHLYINPGAAFKFAAISWTWIMLYRPIEVKLKIDEIESFLCELEPLITRYEEKYSELKGEKDDQKEYCRFVLENSEQVIGAKIQQHALKLFPLRFNRSEAVNDFHRIYLN